MATTATPERFDSETTLAALQSVAQGKVIPGDVVHPWLASWGTTNELPPPVAPAVTGVATEPPQSQGWNGQNFGISHIDSAQNSAISGMPTFMKSVKR